ncbi:MAG: General secretion pathway protein G [uncultured Campylobacterales bacterium]|uniref:Type II secretion system core protein G n=1 Tax=uncultured Campylobacterales bacterium TaxID=352960 RepID=A0A6S6T6D3_9BACT|nr:MAG: General secretion pathway protein G [uncultured Campylobacterales bacterium]
MRKAFSLLEIMVVVLIIGLLSSLVVPGLVGKSEEAKRKLTCVNMQSVSELLDMFKLDNGVYPDTEDGLAALKKNPNPEKYTNYATNAYAEAKSKLKDPWQRDFIYINDEGNINLLSLGADGQEGGSGGDADMKLSACKF